MHPDPFDHAIRALGVTKSYRPGTSVIEKLDLFVERGEWVAVMGPSGCGKSTLLHLLAGLDRPDAGEVYLDGHRIDDRSESARAVIRRRAVGYVFQFHNLVPHLDVQGNVALPLRLAGVGARAARQRAMEALGEVGVAELAAAAPATLSGGQSQRVALARAIATRPTILLADEPTGSLDTYAAREVLDMMRGFHAGGQTIVMVTHDHRVAAAADRVLLMRDGQFVDERRLAGSDEDPTRTGFANLLPLESW
jgi:putative ABC transport system ATP-binding protein